MRKFLLCIMLALVSVSAMAQIDKADVRRGNRKFKKDKFKEAELEYRRAAVKDSTSMAAQYNLASSLYRQGDYEAAGKALETVADETAPAQVHFNAGDVALQKQDYASAVSAFREALLRDPADLEAKENYIYAKKMLENQQNQGGGENNQDQDKDQNQNQDNQPQQQPQDNQEQEDNPQISTQQARQMLNAIQAKEKETQDKVKKEKAELLKSKQKEKNW